MIRWHRSHRNLCCGFMDTPVTLAHATASFTWWRARRRRRETVCRWKQNLILLSETFECIWHWKEVCFNAPVPNSFRCFQRIISDFVTSLPCCAFYALRTSNLIKTTKKQWKKSSDNCDPSWFHRTLKVQQPWMRFTDSRDRNTILTFLQCCHQMKTRANSSLKWEYRINNTMAFDWFSFDRKASKWHRWNRNVCTNKRVHCENVHFT